MIIQKFCSNFSEVWLLEETGIYFNDQSKFAKDETLQNFVVNPNNAFTRFSKNLISLKV